jgi:hypothetical protein
MKIKYWRAKMAKQGCVLQQSEVRRIVSLLASTDMAIPAIAERFGCSRSAVVSINRKFQVRDYAGHRSTWEVSPAWREKQLV